MIFHKTFFFNFQVSNNKSFEKLPETFEVNAIPERFVANCDKVDKIVALWKRICLKMRVPLQKLFQPIVQWCTEPSTFLEMDRTLHLIYFFESLWGGLHQDLYGFLIIFSFWEDMFFFSPPNKDPGKLSVPSISKEVLDCTHSFGAFLLGVARLSPKWEFYG